MHRARLIEPTGSRAAGDVVAVKLLDPRLAASSPAAVRRFEHEAALLRRVGGDVIASGRDEIDGVAWHWIATDLAPGRSLEELSREMGRMAEPLARGIGLRLARALGELHAARIVHCDVKPDNVRLTDAFDVRLLDLGAAIDLDDDAGAGDEVMAGTPEFAAPEQLAGGHVSAATDLRALGIVLHVLLTRCNPFAADDAVAVTRRHLELDVPDVRALAPEATPEIAALLACLLARDPSQRPASAAEVAQVLEGSARPAWLAARLDAASSRGALPAARDATPFWGREDERAAIREAWTQAREGRGRTIHVTGDAGTGKSRLIAEALRACDVTGNDAWILAGGHEPSGHDHALAGFARAWRSAFGWSGPAEAERRMTDIPALAPEIAKRLAGRAGDEALSPQAMQESARRLVRSLARERPVILVLEDLHFASAEARALVVALARAGGELPLLLVTTSRTADDPELAALADIEAARVLPLASLAAHDVSSRAERLFEGPGAREAARRLAQLSGGHPLFVAQILESWIAEGSLERRDGERLALRAAPEDLRAPPSVAELVLGRAQALAPDDRRMLEIAAVQGASIEPGLVAACAGLSELDALRSLSRVEGVRGLLRSAGTRFAFEHHLILESLLVSLDPETSRALHAATADALDARGDATTAELARHRLLGGDAVRGVALACKATDDAWRRHAHDMILELTGLALAMTDVPARDRATLLLRRGASLRLRGRNAELPEISAAALGAARAAGDRGLVLRARMLSGSIREESGDIDAARRSFLAVATEARDFDDADQEVKALVALAALEQLNGRVDVGLTMLERARHALGHDASPDQRMRVLVLEGGLLFHSPGRLDEAEANFQAVVELSRALGDRSAESIALSNLGLVMQQRGEYARAVSVHERSRDVMREIGHREKELVTVVNLGNARLQLGDYARAHEDYVAAVEIGREIGAPLMVARALGSVGAVELVLGRIDEAIATLAETCERLTRAHAMPHLAWFHAILGTTRLQAGDRPGARRDHEDAVALTRARSEAAVDAMLSGMLVPLARCLIACGERRRAVELLREAAQWTGICPVVHWAPPRAWLAFLGEGDPRAVEIPPTLTAQSRAETHWVLWRAGAGDEHLAASRAQLHEIAARLPESMRATFWSGNPLACRVGRV